MSGVPSFAELPASGANPDRKMRSNQPETSLAQGVYSHCENKLGVGSCVVLFILETLGVSFFLHPQKGHLQMQLLDSTAAVFRWLALADTFIGVKAHSVRRMIRVSSTDDPATKKYASDLLCLENHGHDEHPLNESCNGEKMPLV